MKIGLNNKFVKIICGVNNIKYTFFILFIFITFFSFLNCSGSNKKDYNIEKIKEEMYNEILLLNNNENVQALIEQYFGQKNFVYSYYGDNFEFTRIKIDKDESVYLAIYKEEKKYYIITHYLVYIIIDSEKKIKDIIFDTVFTGP
jgi:hypothetical protein